MITNSTKDILLRLLKEERLSIQASMLHAKFNLDLAPDLRLTPIEDESQLRRTIYQWERELKLVEEAEAEIKKI